MIQGIHGMFYTSEPTACREFLRDKLGLSTVDVGDGWLINRFDEADMGCHPSDASDGAPSGTHNVSFYCDDIEQTVRELKARGVEFLGEITDRGFGLLIGLELPGGVKVDLYQPKYDKDKGIGES